MFNCFVLNIGTIYPWASSKQGRHSNWITSSSWFRPDINVIQRRILPLYWLFFHMFIHLKESFKYNWRLMKYTSLSNTKSSELLSIYWVVSIDLTQHIIPTFPCFKKFVILKDNCLLM